jgi:hypothetical protein
MERIPVHEDGLFGLIDAGLGSEYIILLSLSYEILRAYSETHGNPQDLRPGESMEEHDHRLRQSLRRLRAQMHEKLANERMDLADRLVQRTDELFAQYECNSMKPKEIDRFLDNILAHYQAAVMVLYDAPDFRDADGPRRISEA